MKYVKFLIIFAVLAGIGYSMKASAQPYSGQGHLPKCVQTSVTSASVPTVILSPAAITTYLLHAESGDATGVYYFFYQGTAPTAVPTPSPVMELSIGAYVTDAVTCGSQNCLDGMGPGIAAVLTTGSTAVKVDSCTR